LAAVSNNRIRFIPRTRFEEGEGESEEEESEEESV